MSAEKEILRDQARKHRVLLDIRDEDVEAAAQHFFEVVMPQKGQVIAGYWPIHRELDCTPILEKALQDGFSCVLPTVQPESEILKFVAWQAETQLVKADFGIMVPEGYKDAPAIDPDIIIVPMLAFDRRGYRLGHGGGYYDATLTDLRSRKKISAVGVAYAAQAVLFNLPVEPHDQKLDWIITPKGAQSF